MLYPLKIVSFNNFIVSFVDGFPKTGLQIVPLAEKSPRTLDLLGISTEAIGFLCEHQLATMGKGETVREKSVCP